MILFLFTKFVLIVGFFIFCLVGIRYATNLDNKRIDLFDGPAEEHGEENVLLASSKHKHISAYTPDTHKCTNTCLHSLFDAYHYHSV